MLAQTWIVIGTLLGFMSVALGAFGAHALAGSLSEKMLATYHTAVQYQSLHGLALILLGLFGMIRTDAPIQVAGWAFLVGTILFSGSLYLLVGTGLRQLGMITPVGGMLFLVGWVSFGLSAWKT